MRSIGAVYRTRRAAEAAVEDLQAAGLAVVGLQILDASEFLVKRRRALACGRRGSLLKRLRHAFADDRMDLREDDVGGILLRGCVPPGQRDQAEAVLENAFSHDRAPEDDE